jgi:hypothetical protein
MLNFWSCRGLREARSGRFIAPASNHGEAPERNETWNAANIREPRHRHLCRSMWKFDKQRWTPVSVIHAGCDQTLPTERPPPDRRHGHRSPGEGPGDGSHFDVVFLHMDALQANSVAPSPVRAFYIK